jgi:hypothetical protein
VCQRITFGSDSGVGRFPDLKIPSSPPVHIDFEICHVVANRAPRARGQTTDTAR